jgi:nucleotide-binding universal stress UspA family protein
MFTKILVGHDGSQGAKKALAAAIALAKKFGAELHSISVKERHAHFEETVGEIMEAREEATKFFDRVIAEAQADSAAAGVDLKSTLLSGHEVETIAKFAREGHYDLLVVGFMGHSRAFGRIWGGTSQNLTKTAPCSVLVVK